MKWLSDTLFVAFLEENGWKRTGRIRRDPGKPNRMEFEIDCVDPAENDLQALKLEFRTVWQPVYNRYKSIRNDMVEFEREERDA